MTTNTTTPSRKEMIDAIYEKIADKTLSFGCRIILENKEIILENKLFEGNYSEYFEENGVIVGKYGTKTTEGTTLEIEKIDFYDSFYNEEDVSDSFAEEFVFDEKSETENNNLTIIGHPVMIGDVLEWIENNILNDEDIEYQYQYIFRYWLGKHLPITEQSDECVKFVYNLISE